jgi:hypothetical protein
MSAAALVVYAAIATSVIGMMLVVAGVVATGFFLPGVILIGIGMLTFGAGAVLYALRPAAAVDGAGRDARR